jgi:hypothetical protein
MRSRFRTVFGQLDPPPTLGALVDALRLNHRSWAYPHGVPPRSIRGYAPDSSPNRPVQQAICFIVGRARGAAAKAVERLTWPWGAVARES